MKKIICAHLYNDFSGSPLVLANAIKVFLKGGKSVEIISSDTEGFLSELPVKNHFVPYSFTTSTMWRLILFMMNQCQMFFKVLQFREEPVIIYVNTLLPFGAALAGKLTGQEVVYHIHETSLRPYYFKFFLKKIAQFTASRAIYVSNYLKETEDLKGVPATTVYNALSDEFVQTADQFRNLNPIQSSPFTVLMLCSLKKYKGVDAFITIATNLPSYQFNLVLNATKEEIRHYFKDVILPRNIVIYPQQREVHPFYQEANLVLNLSKPTEWVETFGMTLLEAMHYSLPVIAPPIGGPTEVVQDGRNGYLIDSEDMLSIMIRINELARNFQLYKEFSEVSLELTNSFNKHNFQQALMQVIDVDSTIPNGDLILS